jgi:hypothetical protein
MERAGWELPQLLNDRPGVQMQRVNAAVCISTTVDTLPLNCLNRKYQGAVDKARHGRLRRLVMQCLQREKNMIKTAAS